VPARQGGAFWQGFLVSLANPATTPFFLAFLPQFVQPDRPALAQLALLSVTFLALALVLDTLYALLAARLGRSLATPGSARWRQRVSGALLLGAALGLALAR
jgi:threonine/homoserine/homoserine lactone efflux protein